MAAKERLATDRENYVESTNAIVHYLDTCLAGTHLPALPPRRVDTQKFVEAVVLGSWHGTREVAEHMARSASTLHSEEAFAANAASSVRDLCSAGDARSYKLPRSVVAVLVVVSA